MYNTRLLAEKLAQIDEALGRIQRCAASIKAIDDFLDSEHGLDMLDSIAMMLIAIGENFKKMTMKRKATCSRITRTSTGQA
jgi:hypothetical protein